LDSVHSAGLASLALDKDGNAHVGYQYAVDGSYRELNHAIRDAGVWNIETVDSGDYVGYGISLDLDLDGSPHLSYIVNDNSELRYAFRNINSWKIQSVDTYEHVDGTSLALGADGSPQITYETDSLKYAYQEAEGWNYVPVESIGWDSSLTLDLDGHPHISYANSNELRYAFYDAEGWHTQVVDSEGTFFGRTSLALDKNSFPHISYVR